MKITARQPLCGTSWSPAVAEVYLLDTYKTSNLYSLYDRVDAAIDWEPMVYISVHHNSSATSTTARGIEVYYNNPWSVYLAKNICNNIFTAYQGWQTVRPLSTEDISSQNTRSPVSSSFRQLLIEYGFPDDAGRKHHPDQPVQYQPVCEGDGGWMEDYFAGVK